MTRNAHRLLTFLVRRKLGKTPRVSARHASELDDIDDLRALWDELRRSNLVTEDAVSWEPTWPGEEFIHCLGPLPQSADTTSR